MRGYQPMLAVWAETGLILSDEFRDGNVPAMMSPLTSANAAFRALPPTVETFYYRGVITHNILTALKRLALPAEYLSARPKRLRFLFLNLAGRVLHHARTMRLRLATTVERLADIAEAFAILPLRV